MSAWRKVRNEAREAEELVWAALAESHGVLSPHRRAHEVMDEFYGKAETLESARQIIRKLTETAAPSKGDE